MGGMAKPEVVISFLQLRDYGLVILMGCATITTFLAINVVPKIMDRPIMDGEFKPRVRILSRNTLIGAVIFGVGWGISGQCPGSALSSLGIGNISVLLGISTMFLGAYVMGRFFGS
jgi:uncharacterized membrane protein YedE/YeeE